MHWIFPVLMFLLLPVKASSQAIVFSEDIGEPVVDYSLHHTNPRTEEFELVPGDVLQEAMCISSLGYYDLCLAIGYVVPDTIYLTPAVYDIEQVSIDVESIDREFSPPTSNQSVKYECPLGMNSFLIPLGDSCSWRYLTLKDVNDSRVDERDSISYKVYVVSFNDSLTAVVVLDSAELPCKIDGWGALVDHSLDLIPFGSTFHHYRTNKKLGLLLRPLDEVTLDGSYTDDVIYATRVHVKRWLVYQLYNERLNKYGTISYTLSTRFEE